MVAQTKATPSQADPEEEVTTPYLGKRPQPQSSQEKLEEMQRKIQKLQEELEEKDKMYREL